MSMQPETNGTPTMPYHSPGPPPPGNGKAIASLTLGILSLFMWLCPLVGFAVSIPGLILGAKARKERPSGMATAGFIMSIIGLVLTVINAAFGAYLGATGQMKFF